ncbi:hypothetical protein I6I99_20365 [Sphingobacterium multivorum]|nr:hypothetical protein [Sphingobacterium multivorum]QQT29678.1 hypothetical protein I6I99_20365 [Sphingobacterium multivorum]
MRKVLLCLILLLRSILLVGQENNPDKLRKSSFYVLPTVELYSLTGMVKGSDFSSRLRWDNNFKTGAYFGYRGLFSNKIFFSEIGILGTISGSGRDIDKFNSGAEIESRFQSDRSTFISLKIGTELIKKHKEKLGIALNLAKDNLKLHSNTVSDLNSRYAIRKFDIDLNYAHSFDVANMISEIGVQSGIGYNYAIATWNKIESLKQPKSFDHSLMIYNIGIKAAVQLSNNFSLDILFSNNSLISGKEKTFLRDGDIQKLAIQTFNNRIFSLGLKYRIL